MKVSIANALYHYYDRITELAPELRALSNVGTDSFHPGWELPAPSSGLEDFFSVSRITGLRLRDYRGHRLRFLDLAHNPGTRTCKTFGSSLMVARALRHIEHTGEPVLLFTPSAANKAVALRDAVLRAYETGAATPDRLRVAVVVPESNLPKIWASRLLDPSFAAANPIGVYDGPEREDVKKLAVAATAMAAEDVRQSTGFRIWYTLDPRNYMLADVVRAFFEEEMPSPEGPRWHAHAVSSAYGLLGHDLGRLALPSARRNDARYFLVQHLETPDLVQSLRGSDAEEPAYEMNPRTGLYTQRTPIDPRYPATCHSPRERLERTFYTRRPPTTPWVRGLIDRQGGDGLIVSLHECLSRYQEVRRLLWAADGTVLPEDPRALREWATVMATVGVLAAIDRGVIPDGEEVLIHGSGTYSEEQMTAVEHHRLRPVGTAEDVAALLRKAADA